MVGLLEVGVGVVVQVGFGIQIRRERTAENVERISDDISRGESAKAKTNRRLSCVRVQFIL